MDTYPFKIPGTANWVTSLGNTRLLKMDFFGEIGDGSAVYRRVTGEKIFLSSYRKKNDGPCLRQGYSGKTFFSEWVLFGKSKLFFEKIPSEWLGFQDS